jgi:hypothetical protein
MVLEIAVLINGITVKTVSKFELLRDIIRGFASLETSFLNNSTFWLFSARECKVLMAVLA